MLGKITIGLLLETELNLFLERTKVTGFEEGPMNFLSEIKEKSLVIIDKQTGKAAPVRLVDDSFDLLTENLNSTEDGKGNNMHIMWFGSGDKVIVTVQAFELVEKLKSIDRSALSYEMNTRLEVLNTLDEESNPVLFVFDREERVVIE